MDDINGVVMLIDEDELKFYAFCYGVLGAMVVCLGMVCGKWLKNNLPAVKPFDIDGYDEEFCPYCGDELVAESEHGDSNEPDGVDQHGSVVHGLPMNEIFLP